MNQEKFEQMVTEFPFLTKILTDQNLSADTIGWITVKCGDRNLLEVTPSIWSHDADQYGSYDGHRLFWVVSVGETVQLENARTRTIPFERNDQIDANPISSQLLSLDRNVLFMVEIHAEYWDFDEPDDKMPQVVVYKMKDFDWRKYCLPTEVAHS